jgi:DNA-damage-inducible protein J
MAQINIRMDDDLKEQAEIFLGELGFTFSGAFNVFLRQAMRERRIPFNIDMNPIDCELTEAELILRAKEMERGFTVRRDLIEVEDVAPHAGRMD